MGATIFIGYPEGKDLHVTLNRRASDALEDLFNDALQSSYPIIYEKIMEVLVLDQISFTDLSREDFNLAVKNIRDCIKRRTELTEWQLYQKRIWEEEIEPLVQQDERYQQ
ncbi:MULTISPECIES: hypothetical protein [Dickeya]|uniref:Uncharacterized protein n=2 Tax=Dickeya TaxID=204037 RepID=A0AAE6YX63_9GAMM|nr:MULTISPECIES: hypothetical protein [Dickeya]QIZ49470.1 hypothetical protein DWG24_01040 [Dickeya zeae]QYM92795.1 hypothetical protein FGI21_13460 [Dickeya zeae]RNM03369.1 hypothetical protein EF878_18100 [Dickeya undicola]